MITIVLNGKSYKRDYRPKFCEMPGCGKRIQFRLSARGVPESSDKYNARRGCCGEHSRLIQQRRVKRKGKVSIIDQWLYGHLTNSSFSDER